MPNPNYQQYLLPYMQYPYPMPMQSQQAQQNQAPTANNQIQNAGFIMVRSEEEAYKYPVAPGNCVTFKVENEPIVLEKSMSFSQLETPRIDRYRLVREDVIEAPKTIEEVEMIESSTDELKGEIQAIRHEIEEIKNKLFNQPKQAARKRDIDDE